MANEVSDFRAPPLCHPASKSMLRRCLEAEAPSPLSLQGDRHALLPDLPLGGRLTRFVDFWSKITSDQWVLSVIRNGYKLDLAQRPLRSGTRQTVLRNRGESGLADEVKELCHKSAVEPVPQESRGHGFYSKYFLVPKKDGGIRPILNLKSFNRCLRKHHFKMETLPNILPTVLPGDWMASVDLKDAYFHVPIAVEHRKYLRFAFQGQHWQYKVTPFGLSLAPMLFTRVVFSIIAWLRVQGVRIHAYLDDLLILAESPSRCLEALTLTVQVLVRAGFTVNLKKSDLRPSQDLVYIGGRLRTDLGRVLLPEDRKEALIRVMRKFSRVGARHTARQWLQILGLMAATISTVQYARLRMRPIQWHLRDCWKSRDFSERVMVPSQLLSHLLWWTEAAHLSEGMPFQQPPHQVTVTTDASKEGWGGHVQTPDQSMLFSGIWSRKEIRTCHINLLELRAIWNTLRQVQQLVARCVVKVECDNTTAVSYLNKQGGTMSRTLCQEARSLHLWLMQVHVTAFAVHRPGVDNELADYLSRNRPDPNEWSLSQRVCQALFRRWGKPQIDLFASPANHKLPMWFGRWQSQGATAVDAFAQTWRGWRVYAFPPKKLILRTLLKIRDEEVEEAIVVVPYWPKRVWFPLLLQLATETPVMLPLQIDLLAQRLVDRGMLYHQDLSNLQLSAWKLTGKLGRRPGSAVASRTLPLQP